MRIGRRKSSVESGATRSWLLLAAVLVSVALALAVGGAWPWRSGPSDAETLETRFHEEGRTLSEIRLGIRAGRAGKTVLIDRRLLSTHELYLQAPESGSDFVHVDRDGRVSRRGRTLGVMKERGELLVTPSGVTLFVDGKPLPVDLTHWRAFAVAAPGAPCSKVMRDIPRVLLLDDFMREEVEAGEARVSGGNVRSVQHGGGMAASDSEEADPSYERAVNPFSVFASGCGTLTYEIPASARWGDVHAEARFYFGAPKTGNVVDQNTLPVKTDMLVVQGAADGHQVAFGWSGGARTFVLQTRTQGGKWRVLERWKGARPALTNWVKIGLRVIRGHLAEAILDDVPVLEADVGVRIRGPFHVVSGPGLIEFDDVRAWSLPEQPKEGTPLLVESRQFAGKRRSNQGDPEQFDEWAASANAFTRLRWQDDARGVRTAAIIYSMPLMGDFWYEAIEHSAVSGPLPAGVYRLSLFRPDERGAVDVRRDVPAYSVEAVKHDRGWTVSLDAGDREVEHLQLARLREHNDRLCLKIEDRWAPLSPPLPGPAHLAVLRSQQRKSGHRVLFSPSPNHHVVRCRNLVHELFERAPSDWSWIDGSFRMDCRWACQDQWNFMACGSPRLPYMTSKRTFAGDQLHEYFICLRAVFPWDAGDASFVYDSVADRANGFRIFKRNHGWYNRRDLNFSFCSDGRNPLSGYSVVFGGEDNRETRLMRRDRVVARNRDSQFLFSRSSSHRSVHWQWWKFTVRKFGTRIRVLLNDALLFDYADPEPVKGGHIGFWSVRNGFALSRVTSIAERTGHEPQVLYVADDDRARWRPLVRDSVLLTSGPDSSLLRVTNTSGGGFFAVRHEPRRPVDLTKTPILKLPIRLGENIAVNLHLHIGGRSSFVRLGDAPLAGMKALLTPEFERGECFQLRTIPEAEIRRSRCLAEVPAHGDVVRIDLLERIDSLPGVRPTPTLTSLTVGNSSNEDYLLAGRGRNMAGSYYLVGEPAFIAR